MRGMTRIAGVLTLCAGLAIAGPALIGRAGTLPNISGTWYANGNPTARCRITQSGDSVSLTNEQGATATGRFADPSTLRTDWGLMNGGRITGTISGDLRRISWSNGTYWSRPSTAPLTPAATPQPTPSPEPLHVNVAVGNNNFSPVFVYRASLTNGYQPFTYAQCVSFRNVTTRVVTAVDFDFVVTDRNGGVEAKFGWSDKGTFTPPVDIDNHCFGGRLWAARVVRRMAQERVGVTRVVFADGTHWQPGMTFLRGFSTSGARLPEPTVQSAENASAEASANLHVENAFGLALENRPTGVFVRFVAPGGAGSAAGIRPGDRIVSIGANNVSSVGDVRTILGMTPKATAIPISIDREGKMLEVIVKSMRSTVPASSAP
jgi:hypothetical protein